MFKLKIILWALGIKLKRKIFLIEANDVGGLLPGMLRVSFFLWLHVLVLMAINGLVVVVLRAHSGFAFT